MIYSINEPRSQWIPEVPCGYADTNPVDDSRVPPLKNYRIPHCLLLVPPPLVGFSAYWRPGSLQIFCTTSCWARRLKRQATSQLFQTMSNPRISWPDISVSPINEIPIGNLWSQVCFLVVYQRKNSRHTGDGIQNLTRSIYLTLKLLNRKYSPQLLTSQVLSVLGTRI